MRIETKIVQQGRTVQTVLVISILAFEFSPGRLLCMSGGISDSAVTVIMHVPSSLFVVVTKLVMVLLMSPVEPPSVMIRILLRWQPAFTGS